MFTDTHCHIYKDYYDDINIVIKESINNNVIRWINNGCDSKSNKEVLDLTHRYQNMYGALGIHPENALTYEESDLKFIENNLNNKKIIAIGEIGLDYHYGLDSQKAQIELLEKQLKLAEKYNIPVIIHSREATNDIVNILKKYHVKGVIHSFTGSLEEAKIFIEMGFLLGVNGIVTFKNSDISNVIKNIPLDYLLLETDSPYLSPVPYRGKQNNPSHIIDIAMYLANLKSIQIDNMVKILNDNITRIFKI